ncbi:hypothetical protein [Fructobacillus ficulneus]|uniref:Uncharacterized protein n=1 Tax=Fructobacillus ficulneus TaxID=157463 RepID=A0A0K8MH72_9LACO|nr:hypothetical protein [Fructobacillus ficulneus]GAO99885.1 hypothetical protein FFIC_241650 [Fructobacillus ficulneus]
MGSLISLLVLIGLGYLIYKFFKPTPKYRVVMTDPVTGYIKYLMSVDGINNSFQYTSAPDSALIFSDGSRAERFMSMVSSETNPRVEVKGFMSWSPLRQG